MAAVIATDVCRNAQLLIQLAPAELRTYIDPPLCTERATREVTVGDQRAALCLWHSLVAREQMHARFVRYLDLVSDLTFPRRGCLPCRRATGPGRRSRHRRPGPPSPTSATSART